jgi:hypothetical protein
VTLAGLTGRLRALTAVVVAAMALLAVSAVPAGSAEPQPLWKAYPLGKTMPNRPTSSSSVPATAPRVAAPQRAVAQAERDGGSTLALILAALAMAFLGLAALTVRALPRRRPALADAQPAPAAAPKERTATLWLSAARASAERARAAWRPDGGSGGGEPARSEPTERRLAPVPQPAPPSEDAEPPTTDVDAEPKPKKRTRAERRALRLEAELREREAQRAAEREQRAERRERAPARPEKKPDPPAPRPERRKPAAAARTPRPRATPRSRPAAEPKLERCAIVMERLGRTAEFRVVSLAGGDDPVAYVARTPSFELPALGVVPKWGRARKLHDGLVRRLTDAGWSPAGTGGSWYEAVFSREVAPAPAAGEERCTVVLRRIGREARWEAVSIDAYGTATPVSASPAFSAPRHDDPAGTEEGQALHAALLAHLERFGWEVADRPQDDASSPTTLRRRAR